MLNISSRLKAISNYIRVGSRVVDVGCDHAYLSVYIIQNQIAKRVIACDINEGPLNKAKSAVLKYKLSDKITLVLSDGLEKINEDEADDIIIAGMGGQLIAEIISKANWLKNEQKHLILQPMTNAHFLRKYLYENGFKIESETAVVDKKYHYTVFSVVYKKETALLLDEDFYIGKIIENDDEQSIKYLNYQIKKLQKIANGLKKSDTTQASYYFKLVDKIRDRMGNENDES